MIALHWRAVYGGLEVSYVTLLAAEHKANRQDVPML
jgi:hypothetical protein